MKNVLIKLMMFSGVVLFCGCLSVMFYIGGKEGIYLGMCVSVVMIFDDDMNWGIKFLVIFDMLFMVVVDMFLLFWDMFCMDSFVCLCVEKSE